MKAASCFSGIGAPELGGPQFDWVWCAEVEKFPSAVLAKRFPQSVNLGDVTADDFLQRASAFGPLDLLVGGPPCQDFSVAGLRAGIAGDRGNLTLRFLEIAHAIRPRNLLVENVPGWLNMPDNAFGCFLAGLVGADDALHSPLDGKWPGAGMVAGPRARAAWRVFDAQYFGVAQRRRRVFVVADFGEGADPAAVLFERQGVSGNTPPRREAGEGTAGTISARTQGGGGLGTDFEFGGGLIGYGGGNTSGPIDVATAQTAHGQRLDFDTETFIAHSLRGEGFDASEDGTGRGTPIIPIDMRQASRGATMTNNRPEGSSGGAPGTGIGEPGDPSPTISTSHPPAIAFSSKDYGNDATDDLSPTLRSMGHDKSHANGGGQMAVAFAQNQRDELRTMDIAGALAAEPGMKQTTYIQQAWQVRRLTPTECHRLQGFPDDHCAIEYRGKIAADGPQYKALGNSWAVPNGAWIIARIAERLAA
jgi:DNA (cytosine-5)-methyltransferase 1